MAQLTVSLSFVNANNNINCNLTSRLAYRLLHRAEKKQGINTCKFVNTKTNNKSIKFFADFKKSLKHHKMQLNKATKLSYEILDKIAACKDEEKREFLQDILSSINWIITLHSESYDTYKQKLGY